MESKTGIAPKDLNSIFESGFESESYKRYVCGVSKYLKEPDDEAGHPLLDEIVQINEDIKTVLDGGEVLPDTPWFKFSEIVAGHIKEKYKVSDEIATKRVDIWSIFAKKLNINFAETCLMVLSNVPKSEENLRNDERVVNIDLASKTNILKYYKNTRSFYENSAKAIDFLSSFVSQRQYDEDEQASIDRDKPSQFSMVNEYEFLRLDPSKITKNQMVDIFNKITALSGGDIK